MRNLFIKEVEKITDAKLRDTCLRLADELPDYFWHIPASSTGKYHPACDLGDGGLVRHSIMVSRIADDLVEAEIFIPDTERNKDLVRVATLFHDMVKNGYNGGKYTAFEHPILAAKLMDKYLEGNVSNEERKMVCSTIARHMGKWTTSKYSDVILEKPETPFEKLVHTADYIASRKYIGGLEEWN